MFRFGTLLPVDRPPLLLQAFIAFLPADRERRLRTKRSLTDYLVDHSHSWDNKRNDTDSMDFWHKRTKEAIWIEGWCKLEPVEDKLEKKESEDAGSQALNGSKPSGPHAKQEQACSNSTDLDLMEELARSGFLLQGDSREDRWGMLSLEENLIFGNRVDKPPSIEKLIWILQNCRRRKNLMYAKRAYAQICNYGLEVHKAIGNHIVPMFVDCGSVFGAQQVFNRLVHQNEYSWTSLMLGYVQCGQAEHALNLYQKMRGADVHASRYTLMALLKACARLKDVESGQELHAEITQKGFASDLFVGSTLVDMYAKCGLVSEAWEVFDKLPVRNVVSWNALIAGYTDYGHIREALRCFEKMQLEGVSPDAITFACSLKACGSIGDISKGQEIHAEIAQKGFERDLFIGTNLVGMYARCGSLLEAQEVFDKLPVQTSVSWNALVSGYVEHGLGPEALKCFDQMQLEGVSPDAITFVYILKACGSIGELSKGREILAEIVRKGFRRDLFVGSALVDMYAQCGSLSEAQEIFEKMPDRDVLLWNVLIAGYTEHGPGQEVLKCFKQMQLEGVSPDAITFAYMLKACGSMGAVSKGREIHAEIARKGFEGYLFVGSSVVGMYAKCGSLSEAREIFDNLPLRDVVSWNTLIAGYSEHGQGQEALNSFEQMQLDCVSPSPVTFVGVLKACGSMGALRKGREIHAEVVQNGFGINVFVGSSVVEMYTKCGSLSEAQEVFDKLPIRDVVSWNTLIVGYAEHGASHDVLKCFEQMQLEGISADAIKFACIVKAHGSMGMKGKGEEIHAEIALQGFERDLFVSNALVDMYAKCGSLLEAREVFDKLPVQDVMAWNALLAGYAEHGTFQELLESCEQMQVDGVPANAFTFFCVLKACGGMGDIGKGQEIHAEISQNGLELDLFIGSTLVDMYVKCGSLLEARRVFDNLSDRSVVSWNALVAGYAENGHAEEVLSCFEQMQVEGVSPDAITFASILKACGSMGAIDRGREIHVGIAKKGFETDLFVSTNLVDMYAKCGSLSEAQEVFDKLPFQDVVSWSAMIKGCGMNNESDMAVQCFDNMQEQGVKPNAISFTSLLTACSHTNMVFKGHEYFKMMKREYGVAPIVEHYSCIADLLARSGHLSEAEEFVETMWCSPSEGMWRALLTSCKTYGEADLGLRCFQHLIKIHPESAPAYVLMANIHASAGRWDDAYRIEELRRDGGAKAAPAPTMLL